jgi:RimJ/RimL family protein N-acetyltransferase
MSVTFRELPAAEWQTLIDQGIFPYAQYGVPPDNGNWRILVAEREGKIIGCTSLHTQVHWDPWYVDSNEEGLATVRGLIRQGRDVLKTLGIAHAFCTIDDANLITQDIAERLGFKPAPGKLYLLNVTELDEV